MSARGASLHTTTPVDVADHRPMSMLHACASLLERWCCCCCCCFRSPGVVRCPPRAGPSVYDVPHGAEVGVAWLAEKRTDTLVVVEQERILPGRCHLTHEIRCGGNGRNEKPKNKPKASKDCALFVMGVHLSQRAALGHCQNLITKNTQLNLLSKVGAQSLLCLEGSHFRERVPMLPVPFFFTGTLVKTIILLCT